MSRRRSQRGQALVESSLALGIFLVLLIGTIDLGRAVYQLNGVTQAAREIARAASVHPGTTDLGDSPQAAAALESQRRLVPGLGDPTFACVDISGSAIADPCQPGSWVRVTITSRFDPVLPLLIPLGPFVLTSSGSAAIE